MFRAQINEIILTDNLKKKSFHFIILRLTKLQMKTIIHIKQYLFTIDY